MKQWNRGAVLALALLLAASPLATGCQDKPDKQGSTDSIEYAYSPEVPSETINPNEPGEALDAVLGEAVQYVSSSTHNNVTVTLNKVIELDDKKTATGRVLLCELTIENHSETKIDASSLTHFTVLHNGEEKLDCTRSTYANVMANQFYGASGLSVLNQAIEPNQSVTGRVALQVPLSWDSLKLVYIPLKYYTTDTIQFDLKESEITHENVGNGTGGDNGVVVNTEVN